MGYTPVHITGNKTGLVQERQEMILPNDAYPVLQNAVIFREQIRRKNAFRILGRLQRNIGTTDGGGNAVIIITPFPIAPGITSFTVGSTTFTDWNVSAFPDTVTLRTNGPGTATLTRSTGTLTITGSNVGQPIQYFPGQPVMGLRNREQQNSAFDQTVAFDQNYAYIFGVNAWQEFIPGTTWTGANNQFFWTTNYFVGDGNLKIFWAMNFKDPIRYTNGTAWVNFSPQIDAAGDLLINAKAMLPYRGRLVAFNTIEGIGAGSPFTNRIRWAAIGTPFTVVSPIVSTVSVNAWRDDIRGKGGFLDIPTSEDIVSVGFVRDNLVIYCERSTWQLRYTGRTIAPFQIERVNSELGAACLFGSVQFDTSLVSIGDKGIVECDSFKSELIDVKIPDFVFNIQNANNGLDRIQSIRDFESRLAYWTIPSSNANGTFPDQRLVYNYENDSWAIFTDSLTALGTFQSTSNPRWIDIHEPWIHLNWPWTKDFLGTPSIIGGNQQGYVFYLDLNNTNDPGLYIQDITGNTTTPTVITSPNHNLQTGAVIQISGIPDLTPFANLNMGISPSTMLPYNANNGIFGVIVLTVNTFQLMIYDPNSDQFSTPQLDVPAIYDGIGQIAVRDNFIVKSKKFNYLDQGQSIQLGYLDVLLAASESTNPGAISLNVYADYNDSLVTNTLPENDMSPDSAPGSADTFFNQIIPTIASTLNTTGGTKFWQRVVCPTRANFITLQYTFSNAQMAGQEQELNVEIDAQVIWMRAGGRMSQLH